mgnify:CR=1 FL=1
METPSIRIITASTPGDLEGSFSAFMEDLQSNRANVAISIIDYSVVFKVDETEYALCVFIQPQSTITPGVMVPGKGGQA